MKKTMMLLIVLLVPVVLSGCFTSVLPEGQEVTIAMGDTQTFAVTSFPETGYEWLLDGVVVAGETGGSFDYTPKLEDQINPVDQHTITVNSDFDSITWNVDVTMGSLASIELKQYRPWVSIDESLHFMAVGNYEKEVQNNWVSTGGLDITSLGTWSSSDEAVAAVSNDIGSQGLAGPVAAGTTDISIELDSEQASTLMTVFEQDLISIQVSPVALTLPLGYPQQYTATGLFGDYALVDITNQVVWVSSNPAIAIINEAGGMATSEIGDTALNASAAGITGFANLTVEDPEYLSFAIAPLDISIPLGLTQPFMAIGTYSNGIVDITDKVVWSSHEETVATISEAGLVTSVTVGFTTINAEFNDETVSTSFEVRDVEVISITITAKPLNDQLPVGLSFQFTAEGLYSNEETPRDITGIVTWASSDDNVTFSLVPGSEGLATALAVGDTSISAVMDGAEESFSLEVIDPQIMAIEVTPIDPVMPLPPPLYPTLVQFEARAVYTDGLKYSITSESVWGSSEADVATISNERFEQGLLTILDVGETEVSAVFNEMTGFTTLTVTEPVLAAIHINPSDLTLTEGGSQQLTAVGELSNFEQQDVTTGVDWASNDETVIAVNAVGLATAGTAGTALITATKEGIVGFATVTVPAP
jgi:hypothetical protein